MINPRDAVLERLTLLHPKLIDLTLERVQNLLQKLGNPHFSLPPVIHVAGTNGKGSVIAMMRAALEAANYKVHVQTSPHLVKFNERFRLAGKLIDDESLLTLLEECENKNQGTPITFFEITTCAGLLAFNRIPADIVLLETGLGGRLDATNVIRKPALTVIMPVSIDHQQFLGEGIKDIAAEKAGILKPGVPCILAEQQSEVYDVIIKKASEIGAPIIAETVDWEIIGSVDELLVKSFGRVHQLVPPSLQGPHQIHNAGVAVAALDNLDGFVISDEAINNGFSNIEWPGRLQQIREGNIQNKLGEKFRLWLDGGHNEGAAKAIAIWASKCDSLPLHLILGMIKTKDPKKFLEPLRDEIYSLCTITIEGEDSSWTASELCNHAQSIGISAYPASDMVDAFKYISKIETGSANILIAGSLYLAGKVLAESSLNRIDSLT
ncbi:MAG: folylpolyglutamate synthase/dihydrofolate synthase family protein [Pseudomonadota bacterium]|nr:folylpolyglutamate synthase/dihydrofolate synthase family protein [Pseudomonadota bacterium]